MVFCSINFNCKDRHFINFVEHQKVYMCKGICRKINLLLC